MKTKDELVRELENAEQAHRRDQENLHKSENLYRLLVENSLGLMCTHDLDGVLLSINPAAAQSLGYRPEDGIGRNLRDFLAPAVRHLFGTYLQHLQYNGQDSGTMRLIAGDGSERLWTYRNVLYNEPGSSPCVLGHALDITQRLQAEAAVQQRNNVLALATHDLRSPLTTILGYAELMEIRLQAEQQVDTAWLLTQLRALQHSATQMMATVEEISDVAHMQMGQSLDLQRAAFDLVQLIHAVAHEAQMRRHGSPIEVDSPVGPLLMVGDQARLSRVFQNVLDNAIKYSAADGRIAVHVGIRDTAHDVEVIVSDCGIGIPAEDLPHVFEQFYRASTARGTRGVGLGLSGSRMIVEQHGGQMVLESTVGQGTAVTVYLPLNHPAAE